MDRRSEVGRVSDVLTEAVDGRAVALASAGALVVSATWYSAFARQLAELDEAYAAGGRPPGWLLPVELTRSATVATAVAVLAERTGTRGQAGATRLAAGLWLAFPAVLLTGSVVHEKVPWRLAALHGGDWLLKLLLISSVVVRRRGVRSSPSAGRSRTRRAGWRRPAC